MNKNIKFFLLFLSLIVAGSALLGCGGRGVDEVTTTTTSSTTTTTLPSVAAPTFVLSSGSYEAPSVAVTIECSTATAEIHYTLDGTNPSTLSTLYTGSFSIEASKTVKAIAVKSGLTDSSIATANYDLYWWSSLGGGLSGSGQKICTAIDPSGNLYVGGTFATAGGILVNNIAKWNVSSQTWEALKNGANIGTDNSVNALAFDSFGNLYAGGKFTVAGGVAANHVARWDGTAWSDINYALANTIESLVLDGSTSQNIYAGGGSIIMKCSNLYSSPSWESLGDINNRVTTLAFDNSGNLLVGGWFTYVSGVYAPYIAKRKFLPATWEAVGVPDGAVEVLVFDDDLTQNMYIGGHFNAINSNPAARIARRAGTAWWPVGSGMDSTVLALAIDNARNLLYLGGFFSRTNDGFISLNNIGSYDKSTGTWHALGTGTDGSNVLSITIDNAGNVYAGGYFTKVGGITVNYVARWGKI